MTHHQNQAPNPKTLGYDPEEVFARAIDVWTQAGDRDQPSSGDSEVDTEKHEVRLRNVNGLLAVYEIGPAGEIWRVSDTHHLNQNSSGEPQMTHKVQRAEAIERRLAEYEEELNETYDEDLPGLDLDALRLEQEARLEDAREKAIHALLKERREELERMSDEELQDEEEE